MSDASPSRAPADRLLWERIVLGLLGALALAGAIYTVKKGEDLGLALFPVCVPFLLAVGLPSERLRPLTVGIAERIGRGSDARGDTAGGKPPVSGEGLEPTEREGATDVAVTPHLLLSDPKGSGPDQPGPTGSKPVCGSDVVRSLITAISTPASMDEQLRALRSVQENAGGLDAQSRGKLLAAIDRARTPRGTAAQRAEGQGLIVALVKQLGASE